MSQYDPALFMWYKDNSLCGILVVHVDDFFFCGIEEFHNQVISKMKNFLTIQRNYGTQKSTLYNSVAILVLNLDQFNF